MRGEDREQSTMFSYLSPEARVPADHPLRTLRPLVDEALKGLASLFAGMYATDGRPSIPPEKLFFLQVVEQARARGARAMESS